jgi:hypothetical protein
VRHEIGAGWGLGKLMVVILDKLEAKVLPTMLRDLKAIDLNDFDQYLTQLLERVNQRKRR